MKLTDLDPQFVRYEGHYEDWEVVDGDPLTWHERGCPTKMKSGNREYKIFVSELHDAQGIIFICPKCRGHSCEVTFADKDVPDWMGSHNSGGKAVRWNPSGMDYASLTIIPSILLESGCNWHGYITNGEVN